jgi:hypothetical protein
MSRLISLIDWAARVHFVGTVLWAAGIWALTFFSTSAQGWDASSVWLASLLAGAAAAIIYIAFQVHLAPALVTGPLTGISSLASIQPLEFAPDLDARTAFYDILANSEWAQQQRPGIDQPRSDWLPRRLDREIHNLLRQSRIKAWGSRCLTSTTEAPESEIAAAEWDNIEIDFAPLSSPQLHRTSAMRRIRQGGFNTVFAGVRFCRHQIYGAFPLIPPNRTPTPAGVQPDWPIRDLFFHIQPDLLDNPNESAWDRVGNDLRDAFALNLIKVWGRPITDGIGNLLGERQTLRLIDPAYWHSAYFTYHFFDETSGDAPHTYLERNSNLPEYTDLQVNRAEAILAWRR